ncbi:MAG: hydrogenase maturation nickel metallochaperone HypA [Firmicutes bacterium]|nr:hydrogenase maturation nickel metallochaperone HypA [Bacillota bacterium]
MARVNCKCDDCKKSFEQMYFFFKPGKIKCPACGSYRVKEESGQKQGCGCGSTEDKPFRFT